MNKDQNIIGTQEILALGQILKNAEEKNAINDKNYLQDYFSVWQRIQKVEKKFRNEYIDSICKEGAIKVVTFEKKASLFNQSTKNKLDVSKYVSEAKLKRDLKGVKSGTKKALKSGIAKTDSKKVAEKVAEKVVIQATNENEIIELMQATEFKTFFTFFAKKGISKANLMKAIATAEKQ